MCAGSAFCASSPQRGSVTAVAAALHLTPSAVSQQLKALEREAGVPLTERSGRGLALTVPGKMTGQTAKDSPSRSRAPRRRGPSTSSSRMARSPSPYSPVPGRCCCPGVFTGSADIPGLTLVCSDQDAQTPDFGDLTPDHDIVIADSPGVLASWRERGLVVTELMREPLDIVLPEGHRLAAKDSLNPMPT